MIAQKAKIILNKKLCGKYWQLTIDAARIAQKALPGQFVTIKVSNDYEPFLRRPFSIHKIITKGSRLRTKIEILYEVLGKGTKILSQKKAGEYLDVVGPLGNGFSILDARCSILVAGGIGVAPLIFLAEKLVHSPQSTVHRNLLVLIGAKTKNGILCEKEFTDLGCKVKIATDNGSQGFKGFVSDLLKKELSTMDYRLSTIYVCGPKPMLKEIAKISQKHKIPTQVSLEEHMACGIGACFGCVVNTKHGYKRVCKEGPVFDIGEIIF